MHALRTLWLLPLLTLSTPLGCLGQPHVANAEGPLPDGAPLTLSPLTLPPDFEGGLMVRRDSKGLVATFGKTYPTGGHVVAFDGAVHRRKRTHIHLLETQPAPDCPKSGGPTMSGVSVRVTGEGTESGDVVVHLETQVAPSCADAVVPVPTATPVIERADALPKGIPVSVAPAQVPGAPFAGRFTVREIRGGERLVVAALAEPTGGFRISFDRAVLSPDGLHVELREVPPAPHCTVSESGEVLRAAAIIHAGLVPVIVHVVRRPDFHCPV